MLKNFFKTAYRNLLKKKAYSFINIIGLSIGIVSFVLILHYANYELSFDQHHEKKDSIFRVAYSDTTISRQIAVGLSKVAPLVKENFPQIEGATHMMKTHGAITLNNDLSTRLEVQEILYTNESFFDIFSSKILFGDVNRMNEGGTAVITEDLSEQIFGTVNSVGEIFEFNDKNFPSHQYEIIAVINNPPTSAHFHYTMLLSTQTPSAWESRVSDLSWTAFYSYLLLEENTDKELLESKISVFLRTQDENFRNTEVFFQPLTDIHLQSDLQNEFSENGDMSLVRIFLILAMVVLVVAYINYINLSTARSIERAKEVGIRKVLGSKRSEQIKQFLTESFVLNLVSICVSMVFVYALINPFNAFAGIETSTTGLSFSGVELMAILLIILVGGSLLSGFYPSFVLSGYKPVAVLKGKFKTSTQGVFLRKGLVTFQLAVSVGIIAFTLMIYNQVEHMRSQDLGFDIDQVLVFDLPNSRSSSINQGIRTLREDLKNKPLIESFTTSDAMPSSSYNYSVQGKQTFDIDARGNFFVTNVDENYFPHYDIKMLAGRNFSEERGNERGSIVINRSSSKLLGFLNPEDAILKDINAEGNTYTIIGVAEDYNHKSLQQTVDPIIFVYSPNFMSRFSIKFTAAAGNNLSSSINQIEAVFAKHLAGFKTSYSFLDDQFNNQYKADQQLGNIFFIFAFLSVIIGCLGLTGLASFSILQKNKEIMVRKVHGASTGTIINLLSKDYLRMILIASLISLPISFLITRDWLNNYSERIDIGLGFLVFPVLAITGIAFAAIGYHIINAANANPAQKLRSE